MRNENIQSTASILSRLISGDTVEISFTSDEVWTSLKSNLIKAKSREQQKLYLMDASLSLGTLVFNRISPNSIQITLLDAKEDYSVRILPRGGHG